MRKQGEVFANRNNLVTYTHDGPVRWNVVENDQSRRIQ